MVESEVIGIVSLLIWALFMTVTLKYVFFLMRADNKGEGGTLSLMALAQKALGHALQDHFPARRRRRGVVLRRRHHHAGHFRAVGGRGPQHRLSAFQPYVLPISVVILVTLFVVQSGGTAQGRGLFRPDHGGVLRPARLSGRWRISPTRRASSPPSIPLLGLRFLFGHGSTGFVTLGLVFLAVTGAEALYADMGHFGRKPIQIAWLFFVLPALICNYLGQGALVLKDPEAVKDPFFLMAPEWALDSLRDSGDGGNGHRQSQAVITGAFSLSRQAIQLGLLPRLEIQHTSASTEGQIFVPRVNKTLLIGVLMLVFLFRSSDNLANAYGIAVTGTMMVDDRAGLFRGAEIVALAALARRFPSSASSWRSISPSWRRIWSRCWKAAGCR